MLIALSICFCPFNRGKIAGFSTVENQITDSQSKKEIISITCGYYTRNLEDIGTRAKIRALKDELRL